MKPHISPISPEAGPVVTDLLDWMLAADSEGCFLEAAIYAECAVCLMTARGADKVSAIYPISPLN